MITKISGHMSTHTIFVYCHPKKQIPVFLFELAEIINFVNATTTFIVILGDFNIHFGVESRSATDLLTLLNCLDFHQFVIIPAHKKALDLICATSNVVSKVSGHITGVSDHVSLPVIMHKNID